MIFAQLRYNNENHVLIFKNIKEYNKATWSPMIETICIYELKTKGKTYKEKKGYLQQLAIDLQHLLSESNLSYYNGSIISDFFRTHAKRYGLVKEFKEEGLI